MRILNSRHFTIQRKIVAAKTAESWENVPHTIYLYEPEVTSFCETYRNTFGGRAAGSEITFNTVLLRVITEGLKAAPLMNSHLHYDRRFVRGRIDTFENIDYSLASILPNGEMMTLTLRDFDRKNLEEMAADIRDIRRRALNTDLTEAMYEVAFDDTMKGLRKGKLLQAFCRLWGANVGPSKVTRLRGKAKRDYYAVPETERLTIRDLEPGTITVSNVGSKMPGHNGYGGFLEIIPPQTAAIAISAVQDRPVVVTDEQGEKTVAVGKVLPICIACDHRALDFGAIQPFLRRLDEIFAHPEIISTF